MKNLQIKINIEFGLAVISHNLRKLEKLCLRFTKMDNYQQFDRLYQQISDVFEAYFRLNRKFWKKKIEKTICLKTKFK